VGSIPTPGTKPLRNGRFFNFYFIYYVYALSSLHRNYIYVGLTSNLDQRMDVHQSGRNKTTAPYRPFQLIYFELCETRVEARLREKYFKSGVGKEKLRKIRDEFNGDH
jgi:putative endonuclease